MDKNANVAAIEHIVAKAYAVISGPAEAERDWDAMRALYLPDARMTAIRPDGTETCTVEGRVNVAGVARLMGWDKATVSSRLKRAGIE